jgi:hypothetical protein
METIRFADREHKAFYYQMLTKTRNDDVYHQAFFTQWASAGKRAQLSIPSLLQGGRHQTEGLAAPGRRRNRRLCRLAFNLWNGWTEEGKENRSLPMSC